MGLDYSLYRGQTETRSPVHLFGGVEGFEDQLLSLGGNTRACISHGENNVVS